MNSMPNTTSFNSAALTPDSSLRIGFFTDFYLPMVNGAVVCIVFFVRRQRAARHQVSVFSPRFPRYRDFD